MRSNGNELTGKLNVFKIEELIFFHTTIEIVIVSIKLLEGVVEHLVLIIVVHA